MKGKQKAYHVNTEVQKAIFLKAAYGSNARIEKQSSRVMIVNQEIRKVMAKAKDGDSTGIVGLHSSTLLQRCQSPAAVLQLTWKNRPGRRNVTTLPFCNRQGSHVLLVFP